MTLRFEDLTAKERAWLCNGCGPKLLIPVDLVPEFVFHAACERHDFDYWRGGSESDRKAADVRFRRAMLDACQRCPGWWSRAWHRWLAWRYYTGVRWLGGRAFSYRERFGTREDLAREIASA